MDVVLFLQQPSYFQPMELERVEAVCDSNSGTPARLWPTRGDRTREELIAALYGDKASVTGESEAHHP
jgi:hypothetical protein